MAWETKFSEAIGFKIKFGAEVELSVRWFQIMLYFLEGNHAFFLAAAPRAPVPAPRVDVHVALGARTCEGTSC